MKTTEQFISEAERIHGTNYNYSETEYLGIKKKLKIICPKHGEFWLRPDIHLSGHGCPECGHILTGLACRKETIAKTKSNYININPIENPLIAKLGFIIGSVYVFINKINNKIYVGKTILNYPIRWAAHKNSNDGLYFHNAIQKYKWESFDKYIVYQTESLPDVDNNREKLDSLIKEKECEFISLYDSSDKTKGYNLTSGGDGMVNYVPTEESKKKCGTQNSKKVAQYDLQGNLIKIWDKMENIRESKVSGVDGVRDCCKGLKESHKGFIWKWVENKQEKQVTRRKVTKTVLQYSISGEFIREWESASKAAKELKLNDHGILGCCRGIYKTSGNYIWKYKSSDLTLNNA